MKKKSLLFLSLLVTIITYAQVGIGTVTPDPSSMLDIQSDSQGLLAPRMTTANRNGIANPAKSLLVFDTTENTYYYNDGDSTTPNWIPLLSDNERRDNYVLVKSEADLPAPTSGTITLDENTYYEINGTIALSAPIDLNNAYVSGLDANEDVLSASGVVFQGNTGGAIRNVTLEGTTAFNLNGPGISTNSLLLIQNTIVDGMSGSVGSISNFGVYFSNIVQFVNNANGITYSNIGNLLLNNQAWFGNNTGTYETFTNNFGLIEKVSGLSTVASGATGVDVSADPTVGNGILQGTVFSGAGTYVNRYTTQTNLPFNFNSSWTVNAPGIPQESDDVSSGNIYFDGTITTGFVQSVTNGSAFNLRGNLNSNSTAAVNLFRVASPQDNRLQYVGTKTRSFQINAALSIRGNTTVGNYYAFFIRKNGTNTLTETNTLMRVNNTADISSNSISGTVELAPNDYVEIWGQRLIGSGTSSITVFSLNLSMQ